MYRVFRYKEHPTYWPATATVYIDVKNSIEQYVTDKNGVPTLVGSFSSIVTYPDYAGFPTPGREGRLYVDGTDFKTYIWTGTSYQLVGGGGGTGSLVIGSTTITGATPGYFLYNNSGTLGQVSTTGTGSVVMSNSPTLVTPALGTPSSGNLSNCVSFPASQLTGTTLPAGIVASSLTSLGTIAALNATSLIVASDIRASYATVSTMAIFDVSAKLISADTSTYPTLIELARLKGISSGVQTQLDSKQPAGSYLTTVTIGSTAITSGTDTKVLFNNAGVFGEYTISGSGNVAMTTSPTFVTPVLGTPTSGTLTNCTIPAGQLTGTTLPSGIVSSSLTSLGTIASLSATAATVVTSFTASYATTSTIAIFDGSKNLISATTGTYPSLTEFSYGKGVTSPLQTQIDGKQTLATNLTSLSGLTYSSLSFVKMSASGTFSLDTSTYLTGNQTVTLSGDISGSGATSITTTIGANKVTNAMLSTVATATFKGRVTASTGNVEDLTGTQATTLLDVFTSSLKGLAPASGGGTTNFLRADGTWAAPSGGGGSYTFSTGLTEVSGTVTANLSTGVSGGQSVIGGTASGNNLTLSSTSHATKGKIIFGSLSAYDEVNDRFGLGTASPSHKVELVVGTLTDGQNATLITATMPTTITASSNAVYLNITSAGSSSQTNAAFRVLYGAGYTGANPTRALIFTNSVAGTASITSGTLSSNNVGAGGVCNGTTTGTNVGVYGNASNGDISIGGLFFCATAKNSATNVGVVGLGLNTGTSPIQVGGYFGLDGSAPTFASAALMCDNNGQTSPIFLARDNGGTIFSINDVATDHVVSIAAGTILDTKNAFRLTATMPTTITATNYAIDFQVTTAGSSSQTSGALNISLLPGYTGTSSVNVLNISNTVTSGSTDVTLFGQKQMGGFMGSSGSNSGTNTGNLGSASNGLLNIGLFGRAITAKNSGTNIGTLGAALNTGTSPIQIGGYFQLGTTSPTFASAALMCDNGSETSDIFVARDNGTAIFKIIDGGLVGVFQTTPTSRLQLNYDQNSITQADANGLFLANATAATSGTQCVSPPFIQQANGWKTNATAGSQDARFRQDVVTSSGSSTTIATWQLAVSLNGGAYSVQMSVNTNTGLSINVATSISGTLTCNGDLVKGTFKAGGNNAYQSSQFLVGLADTNTQKYRQTNGGGDINTKLLCVYNGSNSASGTLGVVIDATKGLIFTAANGSLMTARAAITIGSLTDTAGSEAADLLFHTQNAGAAYAANMRISKAGNVVIGNEAALSTSATDGFLYIPTCAGTPTGVPTAYTGKKAMVWDSTNKKLYIYDGSWIGGTVPGAFT